MRFLIKNIKNKTLKKMKCFKIKTILCIIIFMCLFQLNTGIPILCSRLCSCDLDQKVLTITCINETYIDYSTLNSSSLAQIIGLSVEKVIARNRYSNLYGYLDTLCTLTNNKKILEIINIIDISFNSIDDHISNTLSCFKTLSALFYASNSLRTIDENVFSFDNKIKILDFSSNSISFLPKNLFANRLPYLEYLDLSYNKIKHLDAWYFYLPSLQYVNLTSNSINEFFNSFNWDVSIDSTNSSFSIFLNDNLINKLGDEFIATYGLCNETKLLSFLRSNINYQLNGNMIECSCNDSFNLLSFIQRLSLDSSNFYKNSSLYSVKCSQMSEYYGKSILDFQSVSLCSNYSNRFTSKNCPVLKTLDSNSKFYKM